MPKSIHNDEVATHSWAEQRCFHPRDEDLRRAGFRIHARPAKGHAVWERGGKLFTETQARATVETERD